MEAVAPPDLARWIREVGRGPHAARALARDAAFELGTAMLAGAVPPLELGAILIAYRVKGETIDELAGFMEAVERAITPLAPPHDTLRPVVLPSYNGARRLPNLTALLALLLRRYGIAVLVHGMIDDDEHFGRVTTAAILWELGIEPAGSMADAQERLRRDAIAYVPTPVLAPGLAELLALRRRLGVRSTAHTLAKLIDPFGGAGFRVVAVTHPDYLARMQEYLSLTKANALLMRGTEGEPFASPRRQPRLEMFDAGVGEVVFDPESVTPAALPATVDAPTTAAWIAAALAGEVAIPQPILNQLACCLRGASRSRTTRAAAA
jgi:anthranilate phosphoribosyltransferase